MDLFDFLVLIGGLAFFLYGMNVLSEGLERLAGSKLENVLRSMTSNPFKAMLLGTGVTALIQSSSAVTVMLVGFVNSGIMSVTQTVGVIMGSNIGTTVTAWLLSMVGIESDNLFVQLLKPANFCLALAFIGILLIMLAKSQKKRDVGKILIGFAVLMYGMEFMSDAVEGLKGSEAFVSILTKFSNPILGILVGTAFTMIIQSSSASVGVLQAIALTGSITYGSAIPLVLGMNIGTCVTALISSIGVSKNARKVPIIHFTVKIIGTVIWCTIFYVLSAIFNWAFVNEAISPVYVAIIHTIFNIATTALLMPFSKQLVKLADRIIKVKEDEKVDPIFLDERLLATPAIAISECSRMAGEMCAVAHLTTVQAIDLLGNYSEDKANAILKKEDMLDIYEDKLGTYLMKLSAKRLSERDNAEKFKILHCIGDFERIGDHAVNLVKAAKEIYDKGLDFSDAAKSELAVIKRALKDILSITSDAYTSETAEGADNVEPLEQVIDGILDEMKLNHIRRLQNGQCTIELGFVLSDLLTNYERISDHCSNIAVAVVEVENNSLETHQYLSNVKYGSNSNFNEIYNEYLIKYSLNEK